MQRTESKRRVGKEREGWRPLGRLVLRRGFYQAVKKRGYIRSRGKLAEAHAFRVGCIGHFGEAGMPGAGAAIIDTLNAMSVRRMPAAVVAGLDESGRTAARGTLPCIAVRRCRFRVRTGFRFCAVCGTATSHPH